MRRLDSWVLQRLLNEVEENIILIEICSLAISESLVQRDSADALKRRAQFPVFLDTVTVRDVAGSGRQQKTSDLP